MTGAATPGEWAELVTSLHGLPDREASAIRLVYTHHVPLVEAAAWLGVGRQEMDCILSSGLRSLGEALLAYDIDSSS